MSSSIPLAILLSTTLILTGPAMQPDILIDDFESEHFSSFWHAEGDAFALGPIEGGTIGDQRPVTGFKGRRCVNTFTDGDRATGNLTSEPFRVQRAYINFLIGGGDHEGLTGIDLLHGGDVVRTATGHARSGGDSEHLRWHTWDVTDLAGEIVQLRIYDQHTGGWGHILLDHIVQSDRPRQLRFANPAIESAMNSLAAAIPWAEQSPHRPVYHLHPPALWMNDPNAPIFHGGYYHMFYQHNPYGDRWDRMHWGHARSRDMVHWEHLPIALWPSTEIGEVGAWSGSAVHDADGNLLLFYTSIHGHTSAREFAQQWVAVPKDDELIEWEKLPQNPVMSLDLHGGLQVFEWRDPFFFHHEDEVYCVIGGNIAKGEGHRGAVFLYKASSANLLQWEYLGILFEHPDEDNANIEVPGFFPLGDKWVLTTTPPGLNEYYIGNFDDTTMKFIPEKRGLLDGSSNFFAPNSLIDEHGRRVMFGWVRGFPADHGWNGVLTIPRVLSLDGHGDLRSTPLPELTDLRGGEWTRTAFDLSGTERLEGASGAVCEIYTEIDPGSAARIGLRVRTAPNGSDGVEISWDGSILRIGDKETPFQLRDDEDILRLRVFVDRSVMEVFANERAVLTHVAMLPPEHEGIAIFAEGGEGQVRRLSIWPLSPIFAGDALEQLSQYAIPWNPQKAH